MNRRAALSEADARRREALRRMKLLATGLLGVATLLFGVLRWIERTHTGAGYGRAFFEAAMVGALADWFAVTALFRHPLGVPIPHTAIIPNRKDQIGASLGEFVQTNFLTREVLGERLAGVAVGQRLGTWLAQPDNARRVGDAAADALRGALEVIDDRDVSTEIATLVERRVRAIPVAPLIGRAIDLAVEGGHQAQLLDAVLMGLSGFLDDHRPMLRDRLERESPWWVPEPIDSRIFTKIYNGVQHFLADVHDHPDHEVRRSLDERLAEFAVRLHNDPELLARGEELKAELLAHPEVRAWLASLWGDLKQSTMRAAGEPGGELRQRIDGAVAALGRRLADDAELRAKVDDWVMRTAGYVIDHYRGEVAEVIAGTVAKWDGKATSERLELQVGRDLQFIRINGTLVGGLAGLVIFAVSRLLF